MSYPSTSLMLTCMLAMPLPALAAPWAIDPPADEASQGAPQPLPMTDHRLIYRGQLHWRGQPFHGAADLEFRLFASETGEEQIGATVVADQWRVNQGAVLVGLDFGAVDSLLVEDGAWLEVAINGTILSPRRFIPAAGWALGGDAEPKSRRRATPVDADLAASLDRDGDDQSDDGSGEPHDHRNQGVGGQFGGSGGSRGSADPTRPARPTNPPTGPGLPPGGGHGDGSGGDDWGNGDDMGGTDGSEGWQVANGKVYTFDRVGINTSTVNANSHLHIRGGSLYSILIQFTPANRWAIYSTKGKVRMQDNYIDATGNVGLGTDSPAAKLQVVGGSIMPAPFASADAPGGIQFPPGSFGGGDSQRAGITYQPNGGSGSRLFIYNNASPSDDIVFVQQGGQRLSIANGGVGVGTTSPSNALSVVGDIDVNGRFGIGTTSPDFPIEVDTAAFSRAIVGRNSHGSATAIGVYGSAVSTSGRGVYGVASAETGATYGGLFESMSTSGHGVQGIANATSGTTFGVFGLNHSVSGRGVAGEATATSGTTFGVLGQSRSSSGRGVAGIASETTGLNYGVFGQSNSSIGTGVLGLGGSASGQNKGVWGSTNSPEGYAAYFTGPAGSSNYFARKVGIGTVSPDDLLHIDGGNTDARIKVRAGNGDLSSLRLYEDNDFGFELEYNGTDDKLRLWSRKFSAQEGVRMTWLKNGRVGIGTENPAFTLEVNGDAGKPGGGSWSNASDQRLKRDVRPLTGSLDDLLALQGVTFEYVDPHAINELPGRRIGMIAQQVEQVFPDWVHTAEDGYKRLTFRGFEALTVEALRELRAEKDAEIAQLRHEKDAEIADLRARLERLEKHLLRAGAASE